MRTTLDNQALFDEHALQIDAGSLSRACIERSVAGLDGLMSIDLGTRTREIRQRGILQAGSRAAMCARIASISAFIDGDTHIFRTAQGREYKNTRMDAFKQIAERVAGSGIVVEYEIIYRQLGV